MSQRRRKSLASKLFAHDLSKKQEQSDPDLPASSHYTAASTNTNTRHSINLLSDHDDDLPFHFTTPGKESVAAPESANDAGQGPKTPIADRYAVPSAGEGESEAAGPQRDVSEYQINTLNSASANTMNPPEYSMNSSTRLDSRLFPVMNPEMTRVSRAPTLRNSAALTVPEPQESPSPSVSPPESLLNNTDLNEGSDSTGVTAPEFQNDHNNDVFITPNTFATEEKEDEGHAWTRRQMQTVQTQYNELEMRYRVAKKRKHCLMVGLLTVLVLFSVAAAGIGIQGLMNYNQRTVIQHLRWSAAEGTGDTLNNARDTHDQTVMKKQPDGEEAIYMESFANDPEVLAVMDNPDLHRVFYGITYTPDKTRAPQCGASLKQVTRDVAILSQLTPRLRMYGTECNQVDLVMTAIQHLDVNMTVSIGVWVDRFVGNTLYQLKDMRRVVDTFPSHLIDSILVGNEALFRNDVTPSELVGFIEYVKEYLHRAGKPEIPVGTSEIGVTWSHELSNHTDILAANVHPFFGGVPVEISTRWTYDYMVNDVIKTRSARQQKYVISEVGWPSQGGNLNAAVAGTDQLQHFLHTWVCPNQNTEIGWYWFEAFDQPWKQGSSDGSWEPYWGLFDEHRQLKNITIPDCTTDTS